MNPQSGEGNPVTVSMRVMTAGDGYLYLLKSVAAGDGDRSLSTPLTRYYTEAGCPPGFWLGSGVASLNLLPDGSPAPESRHLVEGDEVSEEQLALLLGLGKHPVTGGALGLPYKVFKSEAERVDERVKALDPELGPVERGEAVARIEAEEADRPAPRKAVAGYDYTFSVPKSASVLWAVSDAGTQALIAQAHHDAINDVIAYLEREVASTRAGEKGREGMVAQIEITGIIATAFDHYDSRSNDPHLHTHVVISNKACTVMDGKWRALDGRPMFAATVALSELHEGVFADHLTRLLGVEWEQRDRGRDRNPAWAITGVPEELVSEFSSRARHIDTVTDELMKQYVQDHGKHPGKVTILKLRAQATLATRPAKRTRSLASLTRSWRKRTTEVLERDATAWAGEILTGNETPLLLRADDIPLDVVDGYALAVIEATAEKRSTWRRFNLVAETARATKHWRFATSTDREAVVGLIVDAAERQSLRLTPPELATSPALFTRVDGTSLFRPKGSVFYSTEELLQAEARLLDRANDLSAPTVPLAAVEKVISKPDRQGRVLAADQARALQTVALSGRVVDLLVGPAGAGKRPQCRRCVPRGRPNTAVARSSASPRRLWPHRFSRKIWGSDARTRPVGGSTTRSPGKPSHPANSSSWTRLRWREHSRWTGSPL
jgi:conjugative relaxase-like TrwC/TraI family protein